MVSAEKMCLSWCQIYTYIALLRSRISKNVNTTKGSTKVIAETTVTCGHTRSSVDCMEVDQSQD